MLILGIILIIVAAGLFYLVAEPVIRFVAAVLAVLGFVLVLVAVLHTSNVDAVVTPMGPARYIKG